MLDCLQIFSSASTLDFEIYAKEGSLKGIVYKQLHGRWSPRLAELDLDGELHLYKTPYHVRKYDLGRLTNIQLRASEDIIQARMSFQDGKKLHLKMKGPDRVEWSRRMTQDKIPCCQTAKSLAYKPPHPVRTSLLRLLPQQSEIEMAEEAVASPPVPKPMSVWSFQLVTGSTTTGCSTVSMYVLEEEKEDDSYVTRMARIFEPGYINRRQTFCRN